MPYRKPDHEGHLMEPKNKKEGKRRQPRVDPAQEKPMPADSRYVYGWCRLLNMLAVLFCPL